MATHSPVLVDELFGEIKPAEAGKHWYVIHTKPRCEKKLAEFARRNEVHYYLPQIESERRYRRRKVNFTRPMFPGYLFSEMSLPEKQQLIISGYLVRIINVPNEDELLAELGNLYHCRKGKAKVLPTVWLSKGLQIEIIDGPLKGVTGIVESHEKLEEVRLQVEMLRQAVMVKIPATDVRVIGDYEIADD